MNTPESTTELRITLIKDTQLGDLMENPQFKYIPTQSGAVLLLNSDGVELFKLILARACNVWPDATPEIKILHDVVVHGKPLQDYYSQGV